jgi:hypothetical protein
MNRSLFRTGLALLALVLALPAAALSGPTVPHKESCDGQLTSVTPPSFTNPLGSMAGAGVGVATHLGRYTFQGAHNFTNAGQILNGQFVNTAADGSKISGTYAGTFTPIAPNVFRFNVRVHYLLGTGRLAGVTAVADVVAIVNVATGRFHYDTLGTWTKP